MANMTEVETEIRAAVAAAQARGLVLTRGITNDGERCCLLGAFAEGPIDDTGDLLGELTERWGLDETDLCDLMGGVRWSVHIRHRLDLAW